MSDDAVLVEHPDLEEEEELLEAINDDDDDNVIVEGPHALQIVSIGTPDDQYAFSFHKEKLNEIMTKIPPGWKVAVVSVVGAFRTGKSFLLSWFLRYMHHLQEQEKESLPDSKKWYAQFETLGNDGFDWRGGAERNTTGIWMWSEPHFLSKSNGEHLAVLLVDTQGMFDNETTMALTTSIFGLSTLLSSYQIYNVDKRIQEDNLQQLALFSEYARMAMTTHDNQEDDSLDTMGKPFQHVEFLVRDWQHFEEDEDYDTMQKEMEDYLEKVIAERDAKDLEETRQQIRACFETVSCYGLVHPGMAVTKKAYSGDVRKMDETFLQLLDRYCRKIFEADQLPAKRIHGRELTAVELSSYLQAYADLFATGARFPPAATLLEATAQANNHNAVHLSLAEYRNQMDRIAGPHCSNYVKPEELKDLHKQVVVQSLGMFESIATFGNQEKIKGAKKDLMDQIDEKFVVYTKLNEGRNPLAGLETYILPILIALVAYILRLIADTTCSSWSTVCRRSSDFLSHLYAVLICFLLILAATKAQQVREFVNRLKAAMQLMMDDGGKKAKRD